MESNILLSFNLSYLLVALIAIESRNLKTSTFFYLIQSIFLFSIIVSYAHFSNNPTLYIWGLVCFITKVILIPLLLWNYIKKVPVIEYQPFIGFLASFFIIAVLTFSFFKIFQEAIIFLAPTPASTQEPVRSLLASAFTVFTLGLYVVTSRRDAVKTVIGIALLENSVHLALLCLAPNLSETTMIGILTDVTVIIFILLYIIRTIYEVFGSTDTSKLSELKY